MKAFNLLAAAAILILAGCAGKDMKAPLDAQEEVTEQVVEQNQDPEFQEAMKAANDILYDVANGKFERFNWLTVEEISKVFKPHFESHRKQMEAMYGNPEKELLPMFEEFKEEASAEGVDWNDVKVTDVRYTSEFADEWEAEEYRGYIFLESKGKPFQIFFDRVFLLDGKWRSIQLGSIEQTSEIPSDYPKSGKN